MSGDEETKSGDYEETMSGDDEEAKSGDDETQWPAMMPLVASRNETVDPDGVPSTVKHGRQEGAAAWEYIHKLEQQQSRGAKRFTHICLVCTRRIATLKGTADAWKVEPLPESFTSYTKHVCAFLKWLTLCCVTGRVADCVLHEQRQEAPLRLPQVAHLVRRARLRGHGQGEKDPSRLRLRQPPYRLCARDCADD